MKQVCKPDRRTELAGSSTGTYLRPWRRDLNQEKEGFSGVEESIAECGGGQQWRLKQENNSYNFRRNIM
ncbi:hypothetical protein HPP92_015602 [Vanilla planifolia]|uniref:Uncharacterized protein n=1 Tax=Vanilla planifolia TaxID=51239 RepID=A0A835QNY1_VANPL|nr:hypothetical protein HPP92_015602 [Vanilla planifolia]